MCRLGTVSTPLGDAAYSWSALDELAVATYYVDASDTKSEGRTAVRRLLAENRFPASERPRMLENANFYSCTATRERVPAWRRSLKYTVQEKTFLECPVEGHITDDAYELRSALLCSLRCDWAQTRQQLPNSAVARRLPHPQRHSRPRPQASASALETDKFRVNWKRFHMRGANLSFSLSNEPIRRYPRAGAATVSEGGSPRVSVRPS